MKTVKEYWNDDLYDFYTGAPMEGPFTFTSTGGPATTSTWAWQAYGSRGFCCKTAPDGEAGLALFATPSANGMCMGTGESWDNTPTYFMGIVFRWDVATSTGFIVAEDGLFWSNGPGFGNVTRIDPLTNNSRFFTTFWQFEDIGAIWFNGSRIVWMADTDIIYTFEDDRNLDVKCVGLLCHVQDENNPDHPEWRNNSPAIGGFGYVDESVPKPLIVGPSRISRSTYSGWLVVPPDDWWANPPADGLSTGVTFDYGSVGPAGADITPFDEGVDAGPSTEFWTMTTAPEGHVETISATLVLTDGFRGTGTVYDGPLTCYKTVRVETKTFGGKTSGRYRVVEDPTAQVVYPGFRVPAGATAASVGTWSSSFTDFSTAIFPTHYFWTVHNTNGVMGLTHVGNTWTYAFQWQDTQYEQGYIISGGVIVEFVQSQNLIAGSVTAGLSHSVTVPSGEEFYAELIPISGNDGYEHLFVLEAVSGATTFNIAHYAQPSTGGTVTFVERVPFTIPNGNVVRKGAPPLVPDTPDEMQWVMVSTDGTTDDFVLVSVFLKSGTGPPQTIHPGTIVGHFDDGGPRITAYSDLQAAWPGATVPPTIVGHVRSYHGSGNTPMYFAWADESNHSFKRVEFFEAGRNFGFADNVWEIFHDGWETGDLLDESHAQTGVVMGAPLHHFSTAGVRGRNISDSWDNGQAANIVIDYGDFTPPLGVAVAGSRRGSDYFNDVPDPDFESGWDYRRLGAQADGSQPLVMFHTEDHEVHAVLGSDEHWAVPGRPRNARTLTSSVDDLGATGAAAALRNGDAVIEPAKVHRRPGLAVNGFSHVKNQDFSSAQIAWSYKTVGGDTIIVPIDYGTTSQAKALALGPTTQDNLFRAPGGTTANGSPSFTGGSTPGGGVVFS